MDSSRERIVELFTSWGEDAEQIKNMISFTRCRGGMDRRK